MKAIGGLKYHKKINDFTQAVFEDTEGRIYIQTHDENLGHLKYEKIEIDRSRILLATKTIKHDNEKLKFFCYLQEDDSILIGKRDSISLELIKLLAGNKLNPIAKLKLSKFFRTHSLSNKLQEECTKYLQDKGIKYFPKNNNNLIFSSNTEFNTTHVKSIFEEFTNLKQANSIIMWQNYYRIKTNFKTIEIGDIEIDLDEFYNIQNQLEGVNLEQPIISVANTYITYLIETKNTELTNTSERENEEEELAYTFKLAEKIKEKYYEPA